MFVDEDGDDDDDDDDDDDVDDDDDDDGVSSFARHGSTKSIKLRTRP